jgi:predicted amidohydrolase
MLALTLFLILISCTNENQIDEKLKMKSKYKLGMVQMTVEAGNLQSNLNRAKSRIEAAAKAGADIVLLPEVMDLGWCDPSSNQLSEEIPEGSTFKYLANLAEMNQIYICAGITERDGDRVFNSAVIIDPSGKLKLKHRKLNELDIAHHLYDQGDRLNVVDTDLGRIGVLICADANSLDYSLSKSLGYMGADIILSPCAWAVPPDHDNTLDPYGGLWRNAYAPISSKFKLWFIGVSNVGKIEEGDWKGWNCIGSSLAFDPGGNEIVQGPYGIEADTILYLDIGLEDRPARGTSWHNVW